MRLSTPLSLLLILHAAASFAQKQHNFSVRQESHLYFIENKGQVVDQYRNQRSDIDFKMTARDMNMFIGDGQIHYQFGKVENPQTLQSDSRLSKKIPDVINAEPLRISMYRMDVSLIGADPNSEIIKEDLQEYYESYYLPQFGQDGAKALFYNKISYKNVYPNIDWVFYVNDDQVKYEFIVHPGGDPGNIKLKYEGATVLRINGDGGITATTPMGSINEEAPYSYEAGTKKDIVSSFSLKNNILGFQTAAYEGTLVIDPSIAWSTYYGGSDLDDTREVAIDATGNVYMSGYTSSLANIATVGSFQTINNGGFTNGYDGCLVKFNAAGVKQWGTYYGGSDDDYGTGLGCDAAGNIYMTGLSLSTNVISTVGSFQNFNAGGFDGFLVKFNSSGVRQWGTFIGGSGDDLFFSVSCEASTNIYIAGRVSSTSGIATTGAHQTIFGGGLSDGSVQKFNSSGGRVWGTYYGGAGDDGGAEAIVDASGNSFLVGWTTSTSGIASVSGYQTVFGGLYDGFMAKFNSSGVRQFGTYQGGSGDDQLLAVCLTPGYIFAAGSTTTTNFVVGTPYQMIFGGLQDGVLVRFNQFGAVSWRSYYGGSDEDLIYRIAPDASGNVLFAGYTLSTNLLSISGFQSTNAGGEDGMLGKFDGLTNGGLYWGSYLGSTGDDEAESIRLDATGSIYVGGITTSTTGMSTSGSSQPLYGGGNTDAFLTKIVDCTTPPQPGTITGNTVICAGSGTQTYSIVAVTGATSYTWTLPGGWTGSSTTNSITATPGSSGGTITVTANNSCGSSAPQSATITVNTASATITPSGPTTFCSGGSVILNANTGTGFTYQWQINGTPMAGATGAGYTAQASGSYTVIVTAGVSCSATSAAVTVTVNPAPTATITAGGPNSFCAGGNVLLSANSGTGLTYQWQLNGSNISGATSSSYVASASGNYTVIITNAGNCSATSAAITVTSNPAPSSVITPAGATTFCNGGNVLLNANTGAGLTYQWQLNGVNIAGATGTGYTATTGGSYTVVVTGGGSCSATSAAVNVVVTPSPVIPTVGSNSPVCTGSTINLTASTSTSGAAYSWIGPGSYSSNSQNPSIINATATNSGVYTVMVTANGCSSSASTTVMVTSGTPVQPGSVAGSASVCSGSNQTYSVPPVVGNTYTWILPLGWTGSSTTNIINAVAGSSGGVISVTASNGCGTSIAQTLTVSVTASPATPVITPAGPTTFCQGGSVVLNSSTGSSYQWQVNGGNISGATNSSYAATAGGSYTIVISNGTCSSTSAVTTVTVNPLPNPVIAQTGAVLSTTITFSTYQWYLNGVAITGATAQNYTVTQNGNYYVVVTDVNNCSNQSNTIIISATDIHSIQAAQNGITVFPNPNNGIFTVSGTIAAYNEKLKIVIINATGIVLFEEEILTTNGKINKQIELNKDIAPGLYIIKLHSTRQNMLVPFIKE